MKMQHFLSPFAFAAFAMMAPAAFAEDTSDYQGCSITPADAIGPMFDTKTAAECEAACKDKASEGCIAWSFMTPSAMFPDKPGKCRMITAIFSEEDSDRSFCGKL